MGAILKISKGRHRRRQRYTERHACVCIYIHTLTETKTKADVTTQIKRFREILIETATGTFGEKQTQRPFRDAQR